MLRNRQFLCDVQLLLVPNSRREENVETYIFVNCFSSIHIVIDLSSLCWREGID